MSQVNGVVLHKAPEAEVQVVLMVLRRALVEDAGITAATETQVQNSLYSLRSTSPHAEAVVSLEKVAANLRILSEAKRDGRCNFYASQLTRLRKQIFA